MGLIFSAFLLLVGFVLLIKGADVFVDGSSDTARKFKVPKMLIGLTIVSFGTSGEYSIDFGGEGRYFARQRDW